MMRTVLNDYMTNYYEIVSCADNLDLYVKWNVSEIAGSIKASMP